MESCDLTGCNAINLGDSLLIALPPNWNTTVEFKDTFVTGIRVRKMMVPPVS